MGWSFRKSFKVAPGIRLNLSKGGVGISGGVKGFRVGVGPRGTNVSAGRDGLYYRKQLGGGFGGSPRARSSMLLSIVVIIVAAALWYWFYGRTALSQQQAPQPTPQTQSTRSHASRK